MSTKRSRAELKRLVESAVTQVCRLDERGLWFNVDEVEPSGQPPDRLRVWATLHFLPTGSPFCCGETECQLGLTIRNKLSEVEDHVRRAKGLIQPVRVEFEGIAVRYHTGVEFTYTP